MWNCKQNYEYVMKDDGFPKNPMPKHWKGEKNVYCAGFARKGIAGAAEDAMSVANDIRSILDSTKNWSYILISSFIKKVILISSQNK